MKKHIIFFLLITCAKITFTQRVFLCDSTEVSGTMVSECLTFYDYELQAYDTSKIHPLYKDSSGIDVPIPWGKIKIIAQIDERKVLNGKLTYIDGSDTVMVGYLVNGVPHGKFITYFKGYSTTYFNYINGKIEGEFLSKNNDGREFHGNYLNSKGHGPAYWLFPNGRIEDYSTFFNGKRTGVSVSFHDNGMMFSLIPYYEGLKIDGVYNYYDQDGLLLYKYEVKNHIGRVIKDK